MDEWKWKGLCYFQLEDSYRVLMLMLLRSTKGDLPSGICNAMRRCWWVEMLGVRRLSQNRGGWWMVDGGWWMWTGRREPSRLLGLMQPAGKRVEQALGY